MTIYYQELENLQRHDTIRFSNTYFLCYILFLVIYLFIFFCERGRINFWSLLSQEQLMHHELYGSGCVNDIKPDVNSLNVTSNVISPHSVSSYHHHHQPSHFPFRTMPEYHQPSSDTSTLLHDYHSLWQWASGYGYSQWRGWTSYATKFRGWNSLSIGLRFRSLISDIKYERC